MKFIMMLFIATSLLTACNNNPLVSKEKKSQTEDKSETKDKDDSDDAYDDKEDKKKINKDDDEMKDDYEDDDSKIDNKDDDDNSYSSGWTKKQREDYIEECANAAKESMSSAKANSYCDCMQNKIETKYNMGFAEASRITQAQLATPEAKADIRKCLGMD